MEVEAIEFEVDGLKLRGKFFPGKAPAKDKAILFLHGWTGMPNNPAAAMMAENGYTSLTFNLRGHNESGGELADFSRADFLKDAIAAYDFFAKRLPPGTKIYTAGSSFGSYLSTILSSKRDIGGMSLRVPANYPQETFDEPQVPQVAEPRRAELVKWWRQTLGPDSTISLGSLHDFQGPVQIIEAGEDEVLAHRVVQNYVDAVADKNQLEYHLMKGWPHSLGEGLERNQAYQEMLLKWASR
jgi:uncharacterized protein